MINIKPFEQTKGFCGPASLKMVLDFYGVLASESEIAKIAGASRKKGISAEGLIKVAKHFGFKAFLKKNSTLADIKKFIKRGIPVIVNWFLEDDGHYSVVADIDGRNILLVDPALKNGKRKMPVEKFFRVWFDFPGDFIETPKDLVLRLMLVITPIR